MIQVILQISTAGQVKKEPAILQEKR